MTIKEQIENIFKPFRPSTKGLEQCEIIADEFAIGFGEYLDSLTTEDMGTLSIKELLEIYKKEKGL